MKSLPALAVLTWPTDNDKPRFRRKLVQPEFETKLMSFGFHLNDPRPHIIAIDAEMKCIHCQGEMKRGHIPFHADRRGCHVTLDEVPAWVCGQCGEAYFEEKEIDAIQKLIAAL